MQVGNVFVKVVARRLQLSGKSFQYMVLAGFDPRLSHSTATYVETLSPTHVLTEDEVVEAIEKARVKNNASGVTNVTNPAVQKKLDKMFETAVFMGELGEIAKGKTFEQMGIGQYL